MDNITRAPRAQPAQITPAKHDNQYAALAPSDSEAELHEDTKSCIEEEYIPNHPVNEHTPVGGFFLCLTKLRIDVVLRVLFLRISFMISTVWRIRLNPFIRLNP